MSNGISRWFRNLKIKVSKQDVTILDLSCSALKEVQPEAFANCERSLEELNLELNKIEVLPLAVYSCSELRILNVSDNNLRVLQPAVGSLLNLEELYISKNRLESIPETLKSCRKLRVIDASFNPLSRLCDSITCLANLTELNLNDTQLESLPHSFGRLTQLKHLDLRGNNLETLAVSFSRLTLLETLDLGCNCFTQFPSQLTFLVSLKQFWIDQNDIKVLPESLNSLENLEAFDVSQNCLSCLPEQIGGLASLTMLDCSGNQLHFLPQSFGYLKNLTTLKLENNQLKTLPSTIANLSSLAELSLSGNQLQKLPDNLGHLQELTTLYCDENLLSVLPSTIGDLTNLAVLSLRSNCLSGLPDQLGKLPSIRVLNLSGNQIRFLPVTLVNLIRNLSALWLSESQVSPKVPLQCQRDPITKREVLTCFLLPQQIRKSLLTSPDKAFSAAKRIEKRAEVKKLSFEATETQKFQNHLERRPTPVVRRRKLPSLHNPNAPEVLTASSDVRNGGQGFGTNGKTVYIAEQSNGNRRLNEVLSKISTVSAPMQKTSIGFSDNDMTTVKSAVSPVRSYTRASAECLLDGPERSEDLEEWVITPGRPPLIKPYAMVDLRTLQLQMRRENESNGQLNRSNGRANNRCNSLHNPYKEDGSSGDINHVLGNGEGRHYESIFDSVEKRRSCLPDIVAAHTAEVSYQNLPI